MQRPAPKTIIGLCLILFVSMASTTPAAAKAVVIKLATLAPEGSSWIDTFNAINAEIQQKTDGQVRCQFYAGGVLGDEKDMLRKMHIGQIHAAALTSAGLSAIFNEMDVFQIPFLIGLVGSRLCAPDVNQAGGHTRRSQKGQSLDLGRCAHDPNDF